MQGILIMINALHPTTQWPMCSKAGNCNSIQHRNGNVNTGLIKTFRQLSKATTALKYRDPGLLMPEVIGNCEKTNLKLQYDPANFIITYATLMSSTYKYQVPSSKQVSVTKIKIGSLIIYNLANDQFFMR